MQFTHAQQSNAMTRIKGMTTLPDARVRQIVDKALRDVENDPGDGQIEPLERVVMLATADIWSEENALTGNKPPCSPGM